MVNHPLFTFDIGTNSIGWAAFALGQDGRVASLLDAGARIFTDGRVPDTKKRTTLNSGRRMKRLVARRLQRRSRQIKALARMLRDKGLLPERGADAELMATCPYTLRAKAAVEPVTPHQLGRTLLHLAKRRGYDAGRRAGTNDEEGKVIGPRIEQLQTTLGGRTLSAFLAEQVADGRPARFKSDAPFYPSRAMVRAEFDRIRRVQEGLHGLTEADWERIATLTFFRRPLKPARPGTCQFLPDQDRAAKALPSVQEAIFLETLANLRLKEDPTHPRTRSLTPAEVALVAERSAGLAEVELAKLRQWIEAPAEARFTIEQDRGGAKGRKRLVVDRVTPLLRPILGLAWETNDAHWRDAVAEAWRLPDEGHAAAALAHLGVDEAAIDRLLQLTPPDGHHSFCRQVIRRVLPHLRAGLGMWASLAKEGFAVAETPRYDRLPYYGEILAGHTQPVLSGGACAEEERHWGRIPNPTVHIALNQFRRLANELIDAFGKPTEVVVETTRALKAGAEELRRTASRNAARERDNRRFDEIAEQVGAGGGASTRRERRLRLALLERQGGLCMYSPQDRPVSPAAALSADYEIDHVLPFSKTLDDGIDNKVLAHVRWNRQKGDKAPWDAFDEEHREVIRERAARLHAANWRKGFKNELSRRLGPEGPAMLEGRDWLGRQLGDTGYAVRVARLYLSCLVPKENIRLVPGKVTAHIRQELELSKSREDHRHHALDAMCLGLVDWRALTSLHTASARGLDLPSVFVPIPGFRDIVEERLDRIVVSHRRDRGRPRSLHGLGTTSTTGAMHDEQPLSPRGGPSRHLRVITHTRADGTVLEKAVRTNGNAYLEIYRRLDGSTGGEMVSTFDANLMEEAADGRRRPYQPRWVREHKGAKLALRLFIGDTVEMRGSDGASEFWVVKQIVEKTGKPPIIRLLRHNVALSFRDAESRKAKMVKELAASSIGKSGLRLAHVDAVGRVNGLRRWKGSST